MKFRFLTAISFLLIAHASFAKGFVAGSKCAQLKNPAHHNHAKTTLADLAEDNYDISYLKFNLTFTDTSVYVSGDVATYAKVIAPSMDKYVFELDSLITIDSIIFNGQPVISASLGITRTVTLATPLTQGQPFTAHVYYHGAPATGGGFFTGVTHDVSSQGTNIVYTVSDPYAAKDWWPCKQSITDKIDSVDMWVTVRDGLTVGSNGVLRSVAVSTPGFITYKWQTKYPIDYYLISVAVAPYTAYTSYVHFTGSTDSMPVQNFFYDTATFNPAYKANFDSLNLMIDYISTLYGRYPFWKEKYGVCFSTLGGGMEHQTMTTIGTPDVVTIAHELGHQWFGDHVTYSTWGDVWLSEGFATYTEQLFLDHFHSPAAARAHRQAQYNNVLGQLGGRVYVDDTTSPNTLFDLRLVYNKAAAVVHMLRFLAPSDSVFFNVLQTYQQQYGLGVAGTTDLKNLAAQAYGRNLDTFFSQWIYGQGYPKYTITWAQAGNNVIVKLVQSPSFPSSIPLFVTPLELQLHSATGDTIVKVYNDAATQVFTFTWNQQMSTVKLDPNLWVLCKLASVVTQDPSLSVHTLAAKSIKVSPNPARDNWYIEQLPDNTELYLTNLEGYGIWSGKCTGTKAIIPAAALAPGNYLLKLKKGADTTTIKLTKE